MASLSWIKHKVGKKSQRSTLFYDTWKKYKYLHKETSVEHAVSRTGLELRAYINEQHISPEEVAKQMLSYIKSSKISTDK